MYASNGANMPLEGQGPKVKFVWTMDPALPVACHRVGIDIFNDDSIEDDTTYIPRFPSLPVEHTKLLSLYVCNKG